MHSVEATIKRGLSMRQASVNPSAAGLPWNMYRGWIKLNKH